MRTAAIRSRMRQLGLAIAAMVLCSAATAAAEVPVQPYGTNDAGGFRNVLPPGENGLDNAAQLAAFQANGSYPPHFSDQLPLYAGLIHASPTLTREQIPNYFKDATFGAKEGDLASVESPRSDVTIARDGSYGVPHVYGSTRAGVMFGAGYAGAADRLFLMDVLRHAARAEGSRPSKTSTTTLRGSTPTSRRRCSTRTSCPPSMPASASCRRNGSPPT